MHCSADTLSKWNTVNGINKVHLVIHRGESYLGLCEGEELVVDAPSVGDLFMVELIGLQSHHVTLMRSFFLY